MDLAKAPQEEAGESQYKMVHANTGIRGLFTVTAVVHVVDRVLFLSKLSDE